jgi:hypothetical protein
MASFRTIGIGLECWNNRIVEWWGISATGNWVRFAHLPRVPRLWGLAPPGAAGKLALFRTFVPRPPGRVPPGRAGIGFVLRISPSGPPADQPNWVRFASFACRCLAQAGPNWVRFAHFPLWASGRPAQLGSFRTFHRTKLGSFCTIGRPQPSAARKLGSFRTFDPARLGLFCAVRPECDISLL